MSDGLVDLVAVVAFVAVVGPVDDVAPAVAGPGPLPLTTAPAGHAGRSQKGLA